MRNVLFLDIAKWFSHIIFHWTVVYRPVKPTPISPHKLPQWARQRAQRCSLRIGQLEPLQPRQMVQFASRARYCNDEYWWFVHICSNCNIFISLYTNLEKNAKAVQLGWCHQKKIALPAARWLVLLVLALQLPVTPHGWCPRLCVANVLPNEPCQQCTSRHLYRLVTCKLTLERDFEQKKHIKKH